MGATEAANYATNQGNTIQLWMMITTVIVFLLFLLLYKFYKKQKKNNRLLVSKTRYICFEVLVAVLFTVFLVLATTTFRLVIALYFNFLCSQTAIINAVFTFFYCRTMNWSQLKSTVFAVLALPPVIGLIPFAVILWCEPKKSEQEDNNTPMQAYVHENQDDSKGGSLL